MVDVTRCDPIAFYFWESNHAGNLSAVNPPCDFYSQDNSMPGMLFYAPPGWSGSALFAAGGEAVPEGSYARRVYLRTKGMLVKLVPVDANADYWNNSTTRIAEQMGRAALLETPTLLVPKNSSISFSQLIQNFGERPELADVNPHSLLPIERMQIDPLLLSRFDPYDTILPKSHDEMEAVLGRARRFNILCRRLEEFSRSQPGQAFPGGWIAEMNALTKTVDRGSVTNKVTADELSLPLFTLRGRLLRELAQATYDAQLVTPAALPLSPDGDMPVALVWYLPEAMSAFKTAEQQELFIELVREGAPADASEVFGKMKEAIFEDVADIADESHSDDILGQMEGDVFTAEEAPSPGVFSYSDIALPPSRPILTREVNILVSDMALGPEGLLQEMRLNEFRADPVWEELEKRVVTIQNEMKKGKSEYLYEPYREFASPLRDLIAKNFYELGVSALTALRGLDPLSTIAASLSDVAKGISIKADTGDDLKTYAALQYPLFIQAIIDVVGPLGKYFDPEGRAVFHAYLQDLILLLENFRDSLKNHFGESAARQALTNNVYTEVVLRRKEAVKIVLEEAQRVLSLPAEKKEALSLWPLYGELKAKLKAEDSEGLVSATLISFLEGDTDAPTFFQEMERQKGDSLKPMLEKLISPDFLAVVDRLEQEEELGGHLRPAQAVSFINRLRYVIYYAKGKWGILQNEFRQRKEKGREVLESIIEDSLKQWDAHLDFGWPDMDTGKGSRPAEEGFRPDTGFNPDGEFYLTPEQFHDLLLGKEGATDEERIRRLMGFLADYNEGYYRHFSPLAFERDTEGREIKAIREHTAYDQLIELLQAINRAARDLAASDTSADQATGDYYRSVAHVASAVAYGLEKTLAQYPTVPFWVIERQDRIDSVIRQVVLQGGVRKNPEQSSDPLVVAEYEMGRVQINPWDFWNEGSFFADLTNRFEVEKWHQAHHPLARFYIDDFNDLTLTRAQSLRQRLTDLSPHLGSQTQYQVGRVVTALEDLERYGIFDVTYPAVVGKIDEIVEALNELINSTFLYEENQEWLGAPPRFEDQEPHGLQDINAQILRQFDPGLALRIHQAKYTFLNPDAALSLYEKSLRTLPKPPSSSFLEWYLSTADEAAADYLVGKLLERARGSSLKQSTAHAAMIGQISLGELLLLPDLLKTVPRDPDVLRDAGLSFFSARWVQQLTSAEMVWMGGYILQQVKANERFEKRGDGDDIHFEHVLQTDLDRYVFNFLSPTEAVSLLSRLFPIAGPPDEFDDPKAREVLDSLALRFSGNEEAKRRKLEAYRKLGSFSGEELLDLTVSLSHRYYDTPLAEENPAVEIFLDRLGLESWSKTDRDDLYRYVYGLVVEKYKVLSHLYLQQAHGSWGILPEESGSLDDQAQAPFWLWLQNFLNGNPGASDLAGRGKLIGELDQVLAMSFGDKPDQRHTVIDTVTESVMDHVLQRMKEQLGAALNPDSSLAYKIEALSFLRKALFEPFNLADADDRALHSRYNINGYVDKVSYPPLEVIFSRENLRIIAVKAQLADVRKDLDLKIQEMENLLHRLRYLIGEAEDGEIEKYVEDFLKRRDVMADLLKPAPEGGAGAYDILAGQALLFVTSRQDPFFKFNPDKMQTRIDRLKKRLKERLFELEAERKLTELVQFTLPSALSESEREKSGLVICLKELRAQFLLEEGSLTSPLQTEYRRQLIKKIENALLIMADPSDDLSVLAITSFTTYDELVASFKAELKEMLMKPLKDAAIPFADLSGTNDDSPQLEEASHALYPDWRFYESPMYQFASTLDREVTDILQSDSVESISLDPDTGPVFDAEALRNLYRLSTDDMQYVLVTLRRMKVEIVSLRRQAHGLADSEKKKLDRLQALLDKRLKVIFVVWNGRGQTNSLIDDATNPIDNPR